jgi:hypothetical protein
MYFIVDVFELTPVPLSHTITFLPSESQSIFKINNKKRRDMKEDDDEKKKKKSRELNFI